MIRLLLTTLTLVVSLTLSAQQTDPRLEEPKAPEMEFAETVMGIGELSVSRKEKRKVTFTFINKGDAPLRIISAETSCGCTTATYRRKNVKPGKKGKIFVTVDASLSEARGTFGYLVTIINNTPQHYTRLRVTGKFIE